MKILYVEDSAAAAMVMQRRLTSFGHDVLYARNGQEATQQFQKLAPDLVLMDIEMPVMNGFEAASQIRAIEAQLTGAWTPIIFLTASDTVENLITAIEAGGDDFMAKSVPEPVLQAKMKAMTRIAALRERLSRANQQLQELADKDGLTGLCNRRSMDKKLDQAFEAARRVGQSFGLLMMDIDNFKKYNDHYGHLQGDECLRNVAQAIQKGVQAVAARSPSTNAFAARYGGEEFAAVLPGADAATVAAAADAVLNEIRQLQLPHAKNDHWGKVTISVGGALLQTATGPIKTLFHTADDLLYRAKAAGRNRAELA